MIMSKRRYPYELFKAFEIIIFLLFLPTVVFFILAPHHFLFLKISYYFIVLLFVLQASLSYAYSLSAFRHSFVEDIPLKNYAPKTTFIVSAYLPNEIDIIEATLLNLLKHVDRPAAGIEVILAYNTPHMEKIEGHLKNLAYKWPQLILANAYGSRSKSENLNHALNIASGEMIVLLDADHLVIKDCLARAWRWLEAGYDVVQGRCKIRNGKKNILTRLIEVEFETIYGVSHHAKSKLFHSALFGGTNGYWRASAIKAMKFNKDRLTEDIDLTLRAILSGKRFVHDRSIVSSELAPETFWKLWFQRKRWAQGWFQCSVQYQWDIVRSHYLKFSQKFMWTTLLLWRVFYDIVSHFLWPIVFAYWLYRGIVEFPMNGFIWFAVIFTLFSGPLEAAVAFKNAARPRPAVWQFLYYAFLAFPYTLFKNTIQVIAIRDELLKEREWVVTKRTGT